MNGVQDHVDLVILLTERMQRLSVARVQIEVHWGHVLIISTILDVLSFLPGAHRLVVLLDQGCVVQITVIWVIKDLDEGHARVLQEIGQVAPIVMHGLALLLVLCLDRY